MLGQVGAPLMGVVLNGVTREDSYGYSYQYAYRSVEPTGRRPSHV